MSKNRVFAFTGFKGHWPVGTAALVIAQDINEAAAMLSAELTERGLEQVINVKEAVEVNPAAGKGVRILVDGDY